MSPIFPAPPRNPIARATRHAAMRCCSLTIASALTVLPQAAPASDAAVFTQPVFIGAYRMPALPAANTAECAIVFRDGFEPLVGGVLSRASGTGHPMQYISHGGYIIKIDGYGITITDRHGMNFVQHAGDRHESLNGKHIKDWGGAAGWSDDRRSIVLGDGSKITMEADGTQGVIGFTSIYDEYRNVQYSNIDNFVVHYSTDSVDTDARDATQYDGETALFVTDRVSRASSYDNIRNETFDGSGNPVVVEFSQPLGTTGGCPNPTQVRDLFDDPRYGST